MRSNNTEIRNQEARQRFFSWTGKNVEVLYVNEGMSETIVVYLTRGRLFIARLFELSEKDWALSQDFETLTEELNARFAIAKELGR